jgi:hypothetical protein
MIGIFGVKGFEEENIQRAYKAKKMIKSRQNYLPLLII